MNYARDLMRKIDSKLATSKNYQCLVCVNVLDKHSHTSRPIGADSESIPSRPCKSTLNAFKHPARAFVPPELFVVGLWYDLDPVITVCSHRLAPIPAAI